MKLKTIKKFQLQLFVDDVIDLPDNEKAERLIAAGVAEKVTRTRKKKADPEPAPEPVADPLLDTIGETVAPIVED